MIYLESLLILVRNKSLLWNHYYSLFCIIAWRVKWTFSMEMLPYIYKNTSIQELVYIHKTEQVSKHSLIFTIIFFLYFQVNCVWTKKPSARSGLIEGIAFQTRGICCSIVPNRARANRVIWRSQGLQVSWARHLSPLILLNFVTLLFSRASTCAKIKH